MIKENIFREYDLRGIVNDEIDFAGAYTIGRSFGSYIKEKGEEWTVVGHDNRLSSPELSENLIKGINDSGVNVYRLGLVTTPMYYFMRKNLNSNTGIMVTASHNPREYNGFKIAFVKEGNAYGEAIQEFKDYTFRGDFSEGQGIIEDVDLEEEYINLLVSSIDLGNRKIKVVYDCGNGAGSIIIKKILDRIPNIEYKLLYCESDGNFPNHHPDPSVHENQRTLGKAVKELGYDLGVGIDGDADRVGIVLENGNPIDADIYLLIMYRYLNKNLKNRKALFDVKCSKTLIDELEKLNIEPVMYRTGNSYSNMMMQKGNFDFGGEYSGHVFFRDKFPGFDDGIYGGLRMIEVLSHTDKKLSNLLDGVNKYYSTQEIKIPVRDDVKLLIVDKVKEYCETKNYKFKDIDGIRVEFNDSWALIRVSNTSPNLTVRFESETEDRLLEIQEEFNAVINNLIQTV
ncbi:MAG: phosphomannomutase/phosphoglucomutase [Firmicutes bacterium]|nr:phosphomannomutase/phosphoglucomutase [Bacillota bacterium]